MAPPPMPSYSQAASHGPSARVASAAGPRSGPAAEPLPVPVGGTTLPVPYVDVRHRTPPPHELSRLSPRASSALPHEVTEGAPVAPASDSMPPILSKLSAANEQTWLSIGSAAEAMEDYTRALSAYDSALLHNPYSVPALSAMATMYRTLDHFDLAVECFQRVLNITPDNGEVWGALGHCYLMMDELQKAYTAYHQALYHLPNPKEPKLWYGIGILYDRYGSLEHAEETFTSVVRMDPNYEKANEIYFRLGIIYKQQGQYESSLECFRYILNNPPKPLTEMDIWFQIGHVYEQQEEYQLAKEAYERVLSENPNHAKVLQQLGGLYMQSATGFSDRETAIQLLSQSLDSDPSDQKAWYLLGRAYMDAEEYNKAYEAYQQTVYRDGKNPVLWCSIGILYFQISQYHDALGAYSRSIRLNPYIPEIWFNLGILYESCNNQISDAIDAYRRVLELEPENTTVQHRLQLLQDAESSGKPVPSIPAPRDVNPALFFTAAPPPGSPHPADEAREGAEGAARPPKDAYLPQHDVAADSSVDFPKGMRAPPDIDTPPRRRADDARHTSPKLPSYAATYADYRHETTGPSYSGAGPTSNRYYQAAPYEWDRQYYGSGYEPGARGEPMPPSMGGARPSSMRYAYDAPSERAHYDMRPGRPYNSMRSPGVASHVPRGPDEYREETPRESAALDARRARRPVAEPRRTRDAPETRSPRATPAEAVRKPSGSAARMSKPEARPESLHAPAPAPAPLRTREVDEDYDDGAASALMGLAGAAASAYEASNAERQRESEASSNQANKHTIEAPVPPEPAKRARSDAEAPNAGDMSVDEVAPKHPAVGAEGTPAPSAPDAPGGGASTERP